MQPPQNTGESSDQKQAPVLQSRRHLNEQEVLSVEFIVSADTTHLISQRLKRQRAKYQTLWVKHAIQLPTCVVNAVKGEKGNEKEHFWKVVRC